MILQPKGRCLSLVEGAPPAPFENLKERATLGRFHIELS